MYLTRFDSTVGAEMQKKRPALILQNDIGNRFSPLTIVAAITSHIPHPLFPVQVLIKSPEGGLETDSVADLSQLRSIDKVRLGKRLGKLKPETMKKIEKALLISLGFVKL